MKVEYKLLDPSLPKPKYQTSGSVAFDLCAAADITVQPKEIALIPTGIIIKTPPHCALILAPRSSLAKKKGLMMPNSIGVVDQDYCGEDNEIFFQAYNFTDSPSEIKKGERICQAMLLHVDRPQLQEVTEMQKENRGAFGSTEGYQE